jgi:hypothetical protein
MGVSCMAGQKEGLCEDCRHFDPKPGEKLFNCTKAWHSGLRYGMQVRADSRGCQAFETR